MPPCQRCSRPLADTTPCRAPSHTHPHPHQQRPRCWTCWWRLVLGQRANATSCRQGAPLSLCLVCSCGLTALRRTLGCVGARKPKARAGVGLVTPPCRGSPSAAPTQLHRVADSCTHARWSAGSRPALWPSALPVVLCGAWRCSLRRCDRSAPAHHQTIRGQPSAMHRCGDILHQPQSLQWPWAVDRMRAACPPYPVNTHSQCSIYPTPCTACVAMALRHAGTAPSEE